MNRQARQISGFKYLIMGVSFLAAFPAAYMVGRSVYHWLILGWFEAHTLFWPGLGAVAAIAAAFVIEGLGFISLYLWATFRRWNQWKAKRLVIEGDKTRRVLKRGYDLAPEWLALGCFVAYIIVAGSLLVVLEAVPKMASIAPVLFPVLTAVGGMAWTMFDEHRDRLAYHGLAWNWATLNESVPEQPETKREPGETVPELDSLERTILELWRDNPRLTQEQVAERAGTSKSTVHRRKTRLEQSGLVSYDPEQESMLVTWRNNGKH